MLVGLINVIFTVILTLINVASWLVVIYVFLLLLAPENKYTLLIGKYVEPVLTPIRAWLAKIFPKLGASRFDLSPLVLWLILQIADWLLRLLRNILL